MKSTVARLLNAAGIAAPVLWLVALAYIGTLQPAYNSQRQYISELAARGAPNQHVMQVVGFVLPGLMVVAFGLLVGLSSHTKLAGASAALLIVSGIARVVAGAFPLDPSSAQMAPSFSERVHNAAGGVYLLAMVVAVLLWCVVAERAFKTRAHWFRWYSLVTVVAAITMPLWMIRFGVDPANAGLFQRASFGVLNLWVLVFALIVWSRLNSHSSTPPRIA